MPRQPGRRVDIQDGGGRLILLQSIDRPVTAPDCTGVDTATGTELEGPDGQYTTDPMNAETRTRARFGYEGLAPQEIGFADLEDEVGKADSWSTYWYNGTVYVNGGLNRRRAAANAIGVKSRGTRWEYSNPQTRRHGRLPET